MADIVDVKIDSVQPVNQELYRKCLIIHRDNGTIGDDCSALVISSLTERRLAALLIFLLTVTCLVVDGGVALFIKYLGALNGAFGTLFLTCACYECLMLSIIAFWCCPVTFFSAIELGFSQVGIKFGHLFVYLWNCVVLTLIVIALNRNVAMAYPIKYQQWSTRHSQYMLIALMFLALLNSSDQFVPTCDLYVDPNMFGKVFGRSECSAVWLWWHCFGSCTISALCLIGINAMTFHKMRQRRMQAASKASASTTEKGRIEVSGTSKGATEADKKRSQERRFFLQALANAFVNEGMAASYHVGGFFFFTPWGIFTFAHVPVSVCLGSNGFLMLMMNRELRKNIWKTIAGK